MIKYSHWDELTDLQWVWCCSSRCSLWLRRGRTPSGSWRSCPRQARTQARLHTDITLHLEPVFVNLLRSPGIDSQPGGPVQYDNPICHTGPPCYMGWRNRILGLIPGHLKRLKIRALVWLFSVVFTLPSPPATSHHSRVWLLPVISLF